MPAVNGDRSRERNIMKTTGKNRITCCLATVTLFAACGGQPATETSSNAAKRESAPPRAAALANAPGADIPFVVPPPRAGHPPFADFAWREFVALNWPVQLDQNGTPQRGAPDRTLSLGDAQNRPR